MATGIHAGKGIFVPSMRLFVMGPGASVTGLNDTDTLATRRDITIVDTLTTAKPPATEQSNGQAATTIVGGGIATNGSVVAASSDDTKTEIKQDLFALFSTTLRDRFPDDFKRLVINKVKTHTVATSGIEVIHQIKGVVCKSIRKATGLLPGSLNNAKSAAPLSMRTAKYWVEVSDAELADGQACINIVLLRSNLCGCVSVCALCIHKGTA